MTSILYDSSAMMLLLIIHVQGAGIILLHTYKHPLIADGLFLTLDRTVFFLNLKSLKLWYLHSSCGYKSGVFAWNQFLCMLGNPETALDFGDRPSFNLEWGH